MIDQYSEDKTGWARFSDDMTMRYRLARSLVPGLGAMDWLVTGSEFTSDGQLVQRIKRVTFLTLNPSTADACKHDPTIGECVKRTRSLGADVLEVVNLFALRSPYPADLKKHACGFRGDDPVNNEAILQACHGNTTVIAAWGAHGAIDHRAHNVLNMLCVGKVKLHHLGLTKDGFPKHPLARGVHRIPGDQALIEWNP